MGNVGEFVISQTRLNPIVTFQDHYDFNHAFNEKYKKIEHAFLWTDTITNYFFSQNSSRAYHSRREDLLSYATRIAPAEMHTYQNRLASFPKNLKFLAKNMALYFLNNGITLSIINEIPGFNPIVEVVIIAVLHWFLIETDNDDIFKRISLLIKPHNDNTLYFDVFFKLIDQSLPPNYYPRHPAPIYRSILKAADQLSTMMGLSGFLDPASPQFNRMPEPLRQTLINLLHETSKKIRILAKIEDGTESPPSPSVMRMIGSHDVKPWQVANAEAVERIRSKMAVSRRQGGKRRKSSNQTQRRKKNMKRSKRSTKQIDECN